MPNKVLSTEVKELDETQGVVTAYANVYHNQDSDGDISAPGSFTKTVKENYRRIRVLKDHNPRESLGVPLEIDTADPYGLKTRTQFNLKKDLARDMFTDILLMKSHGLNAELSIGYGDVKRGNKSDSRIITEYGWLGEYSFLSSWAANDQAIVLDAKSLKTPNEFITLLIKAYDLNYSDARLKQIENLLVSLTTEPDKGTTLSAQPIQTIKSFTQHLSF